MWIAKTEQISGRYDAKLYFEIAAENEIVSHSNLKWHTTILTFLVAWKGRSLLHAISKLVCFKDMQLLYQKYSSSDVKENQLQDYSADSELKCPCNQILWALKHSVRFADLLGPHTRLLV